MTWTYLPVNGCRIDSQCDEPSAQRVVDRFRRKCGATPSAIGVPHNPWSSHCSSCPATIIRDWEVDDLLMLQWRLRAPFTHVGLEKLREIARTNFAHAKVEMSLTCTWQERGEISLSHPLHSFDEQVHQDGLGVMVDPTRDPDFQEEDWNTCKVLFERVSEAWNLQSQFTCEDQRFGFHQDRADLDDGQLVVAQSSKSVEWACYRRLEEFDAAESYFTSGLQAMSQVLGDPLMIGLTLSAFPSAAKQCARICEEIAPKWLVWMIGRLQVENLFEHPGYETLYPYRWHSARKDGNLADPFLDFQVSIEHRADGKSYLLLHTNHPTEWLTEGLEELGLASQSVELQQNEIYADLDAVT